ncbi:MAG: alpha/beta hydrolase [Pseudomonadota bacterium]
MPTLNLPDLSLNYRRAGSGFPLILIHGWPEWSEVWRHNIPVLAQDFDVIAPDLRNFGDSTGAEAAGIETYVDDLIALADHLGLDQFGLIGHDVGAFMAPDVIRSNPGRVAGLFVFNCPHFGIGPRWVQDGHVREIWYQTFHQLPIAPALVGASRETCRTYFRYFLQHWAADETAFDDDLELWVDNFLKPGRLEGGFRWYAAANERRLAALGGNLPPSEPINVPAYSYWGSEDPILKVEWQPTLKELFTNVTLERAEGAGHFVHWENPEASNARIAAFFKGVIGAT